MRYILLCIVMALSACEVVFLPDTSLPDRPIVVHDSHAHHGSAPDCYMDPPFYHDAEWCDYWGNEVYCTYYVGYDCYEEWVHDKWCGWSYVDSWCVY